MHDRSLRPALLLGLGLGGFADGILMHQILQWHHLVADAGDEVLWDGIFHAATWTLTVVGAAATINAWRRRELAPPWRAHVGAMLAGWGIFNLVDSANHFVFDLHHIRDDLGAPVGWDIGFLVFALVLIAAGVLLVRRDA